MYVGGREFWTNMTEALQCVTFLIHASHDGITLSIQLNLQQWYL